MNPRVKKLPRTPRMNMHNERTAFTLIELMVVISIIALLLAILLPVLGMANRTARQSVCLSNLRQAGIGTAAYVAENEEYVPGPHTSGMSIILTGIANPVQSSPLQSDDWISPTMWDGMGLPSDSIERFPAIFGNDFRCPDNPFFYNGMFTPSGAVVSTTLLFPKAVPYSSYSTPMGMHYYSNVGHAGNPNFYSFDTNDRAVDVEPAGHSFRISTMGTASMKAAAMDGSRYVNGGDITFSTNVKASQNGGNFMTRGPTLNAHYQNSGNPYKTRPASPSDAYGTGTAPSDDAKLYAYRHPNDSMNIVFYDGHAANFNSYDSRNVHFYFPSKSVVINANNIVDPEAYNGLVIK